MEISHPGLDGVESDTLGYHVLTALAPHVKGSLVANLRATYSLALYDNEGFLLG